MTATPTRAGVGDTITFFVEATGASLVNLAMEFGDGGVDSLAALGATAATFRPRHAYGAVGSYLARATVVDVAAFGEQRISDSARIEIVP